MSTRLQLLISTMNDDYDSLTARMNIRCDAIVINQCDTYRETIYHDSEKVVRWFDSPERGIGRSRNEAILHSTGEILLFCDDDCTYYDTLEAQIVDAFDGYPGVDMLLFDFASVSADSRRRGFRIDHVKRVGLFSCMRYGAVRFAIRRESLLRANVTFSLLFGGGARYMCGEDTLFIKGCLKAGLRVMALPIEIGAVDFSQSSWFEGYTEKYFLHRGALHYAVMGRLHWIVSLRHVAIVKMQSNSVGLLESYRTMLDGAREYGASCRKQRGIPAD